MKAALPFVLLAALALHVGAHVAIAIGLLRARGPARACGAFFLPPLAPLWAWREGMRRRVVAWSVALAVYAVGVALA